MILFRGTTTPHTRHMNRQFWMLIRPLGSIAKEVKLLCQGEKSLCGSRMCLQNHFVVECACYISYQYTLRKSRAV